MTEDDLNKVLAVTKKVNNQLNGQIFAEQMKQLEIRKELGRMYAENKCPHIAGSSCLSSAWDMASRTAIAWHRARPDDPRSDVGVCTVCQRVFDPEDPDYEHWRKRPSFNKLSVAGVGVPLGEGEVIPKDQFVSGWENKAIKSRQSAKTEKDILLLPLDEFDKCSDFEIRKAIEYEQENMRSEKERRSRVEHPKTT